MLGPGLALLAALLAVEGTALRRDPRGSTRNYRLPSTPELAAKWGYQVEPYDVTTEDGYILTIFRIGGRADSVPGRRGKILLLMPGFIVSSDFYFIMDGKPLPLAWVDEGYDVWLGNVRGNRYGKRHRRLSSTDVDFWDCSFHEMAVADLPAIIDAILATTNRTSLGYVGHSQGTTILHVLLAEKPRYNAKIAVGVDLAPVVHLGHNDNPILEFLAVHGQSLLELGARLKFIELLSLEGPLLELTKGLCMDPFTFAVSCRRILIPIVGNTNNGQNDENLLLLLKYVSSSPFKSAVHYSQLLRSGKFQQFKYRTASENIAKYGSVEPPEYKIENAKIPIIMMTAPDDRLTIARDVETLASELPNVIFKETFPYQYYGHFSITLARNASRYVYKRLTPILRKIPFD